jgi:hypothetical protein
MPDERLVTLLLGRDGSARDGALKGLLSALWSFLQHSPANIDMHLTALEERIRGPEARLVGDFKSAVDTGVIAVEDTIAGVEHRLESEFERGVHGRVAAIQVRIEAVRKRVVEDLKYELRRVVLMATLVMGCAVLGLIGLIFGLMAAWTELKGFIGSVGASLVLAMGFVVASLVLLGLLRSFLHRTQLSPSTKNIVT